MKDSLKRAIYKYRLTHSRSEDDKRYYQKKKIFILWLKEFSNLI